MPEPMHFTPAKYRLLFDYPITRRKRYHMLIDQAGELEFSAPTVEGILEHLLEAGENGVLVEGDYQDYLLTFTRAPDSQGTRLRGKKVRKPGKPHMDLGGPSGIG